MKIVIDDFNEMIQNKLAYRGTTGGHTLHDVTNENGPKLIEFACRKNMTSSSALFLIAGSTRKTLAPPDRTTSNQIDHSLIEK